jgi:hypothetical protein
MVPYRWTIADPRSGREDMSVGTVVVAHQVGWRRGPGKNVSVICQASLSFSKYPDEW